MSRRRNQEQREAFEELQRRKKRRIAREQQKTRQGQNRQQASANGTARRANQPRQGEKKKVRRRGRRRPHRFGLFLVTVQAILSMILVGLLEITGMIPLKYTLIVGIVLFLFFILTLSTQMKRKKKAIGGKLLSMLLIVAMGFGTFYVGKMNGALSDIAGQDHQVDNMVVAVLKDDAAEDIMDAKNYTFGVQRRMGREDVQTMVEFISEEVNREIETKEVADLHAQAKALLNHEVDAIIYNQSYTSIILENYPDYEKDVRIICQHKIKKELSSGQLDVSVKEPFILYISGIDQYSANYQKGEKGRSDVNILGVVNPKSHQVLLVTTPRDYYVPIPGVSGGQLDKLNHAGLYSVETSMATLEELYDIEIPFYLRVNFTAAIRIVDQIGGLDVYSEYEFTTSKDSQHVMDVQKGMNHFNGQETLAFARERQKVPGGDNQRGKNQQAVITAMIKKMVSPDMLVKAGGVIETVSDNMETNMSSQQIKSLINMQLKKGGGWNIYSVAAVGENGRDICYSAKSAGPLCVVYKDEESIDEIKEIIQRVLNGEVIEGSELAEEQK